jgi:hypothetical protein
MTEENERTTEKFSLNIQYIYKLAAFACSQTPAPHRWRTQGIDRDK